MKNENRNQTENRFDRKEITNDTNSEAEWRITMIMTFRYQVVQTRDSFIIQVYVDRWWIHPEIGDRGWLDTCHAHGRLASKYRWFSESCPRRCVYFLNQPKFGSIHF